MDLRRQSYIFLWSAWSRRSRRGMTASIGTYVHVNSRTTIRCLNLASFYTAMAYATKHACGRLSALDTAGPTCPFLVIRNDSLGGNFQVYARRCEKLGGYAREDGNQIRRLRALNGRRQDLAHCIERWLYAQLHREVMRSVPILLHWLVFREDMPVMPWFAHLIRLSSAAKLSLRKKRCWCLEQGKED